MPQDNDREPMLPMHIGGTKDDIQVKGRFQAALSLTMYACCSIGMVLANKAISMSLEPEAREHIPAIGCVMYQALVAVICVEFAKAMKWVDYPNFQSDVAKAWLPCNVLFVSMLCTGFLALRFVSVPMVTIFKNMSNLITVTGDYFIFGQVRLTSYPYPITTIAYPYI
mgnify:CR=1 FL=1